MRASSGRSRRNWGFRMAAPTTEADPSEEAMTMPAIWTIRARRHLRQALAEALCRESHGAANPGPQLQGCTGVLEATMDQLSEILAVTFEGKTVVVQDQVIGFRRREGWFILMVEVVDPNEGSMSSDI